MLLAYKIAGEQMYTMDAVAAYKGCVVWLALCNPDQSETTRGHCDPSTYA